MCSREHWCCCRYDLGSGRKVLRSRQPITLGRFQRLSAKRYGRDGVLRLDGGRDVSGVSPGHLRSLNVGMPLYLGNVANATDTYVRCVVQLYLFCPTASSTAQYFNVFSWKNLSWTCRPRAGCGSRAPCGLRMERIDPLRFLAGCLKRRLNQALSVLSPSIGFFWVCFVVFIRAALMLRYYAPAP